MQTDIDNPPVPGARLPALLPTGADDRALVRRYNFLGFPGEKKGEALTYAGLRAELGDDNASALVVRVGVLAKVHHLDQFGVGIDGAVARMIQSMTPDERRTAAQSGILPPHVEAMVTAEAELARIQQKQLGVGPNGGTHDPSLAPTHVAGLGAFGFGASRGLSAQGDGSRSSTPSSAAYGQNMGSTSDPGFLHSVGITGGTAAALGELGFKTRDQVRQVVQDTRDLRLAPDKGAVVDVARLKKDSGERFEGHKHSLQDYGDELRTAQHEGEEAQKEADPTKRAERLRHAEEMRQAAEQKQDQYRDHSTRTKQEKKDYEAVRQRVKISVEIHSDLRSKLENERGVEGARDVTYKEVVATLKTGEAKKLQDAQMLSRQDIEKRVAKPVSVAKRNLLSGDDDVAEDTTQNPARPSGDVKTAQNAPSSASTPEPRDAPAARETTAAREPDKQSESVRRVASNDPPKNDKGEKEKTPAKSPERPVVQARLNTPSGPTAA